MWVGTPQERKTVARQLGRLAKRERLLSTLAWKRLERLPTRHLRHLRHGKAPFEHLMDRWTRFESGADAYLVDVMLRLVAISLLYDCCERWGFETRPDRYDDLIARVIG